MPITDEIRGMSDADLRARVLELEEERFRLKFRAATETLEQPLRLRTVRRDIARLLTVLRQREIAAEPKQEQTPKERRRANRKAGRAAERAAVKAADKANRKKPSAARRPKGSGGRAVKGPKNATGAQAGATATAAAAAAPTT